MSKTKAKSRAAARAAKRAARAGMPMLAPSRKRDASGCYVERTRQQAADPEPMRTALAGRAKDAGLDPTKKANLEAVKAVTYSDDQGRALAYALGAQEAASLHKVWVGLTNATSRYNGVVIGGKPGMDSYARELVRDPVDTEDAQGPDTRDEAEKVEAATRAMMAWHGHLGELSAGQQALIWQQVRGTGARVWYDGRVTPAGMAFVSAIGALADVVEREGRR